MEPFYSGLAHKKEGWFLFGFYPFVISFTPCFGKLA
jgi:hypothetical protein